MGKVTLTAKRDSSTDSKFFDDGNYSREAEQISFTFDEDFTCNEFANVCRAMGIALGYAKENIDDALGEYNENRIDNNVIELGDDLFNPEDIQNALPYETRQISEDLFQKILVVLEYIYGETGNESAKLLYNEIKEYYKN